MNTNAKFLEEDYVNNFKPKSKVILKELDSAQESPKPPKFGPIVPLFPVRVQHRENENILEGEQARVEPVVHNRYIYNWNQNNQKIKFKMIKRVFL